MKKKLGTTITFDALLLSPLNEYSITQTKHSPLFHCSHRTRDISPLTKSSLSIDPLRKLEIISIQS